MLHYHPISSTGEECLELVRSVQNHRSEGGKMGAVALVYGAATGLSPPPPNPSDLALLHLSRSGILFVSN